MSLGQQDVFVEGVGRLADGTYHIILHICLLAVEVDDFVVGIVEGRADEFRETCIDDGELFDGILLHVEHLGDEGTALCYNGTAQLEVNGLSGTHLQMLLIHSEVVLEVGDGVALRIFVVNTKTATNIDDF